ncbi:MAG: DeoR/GlpR family DNA-binding transcription regulator [Lachnospiraceae bacterium]|nr:DeoR/GlpR family DNA-binding transcription regulator [Lachnospiraceae bacterium]
MPVRNDQDSPAMFAEERKNQILELLDTNGKIVVPELCDIFDVSASTIRNDLRDLENAGKLKRTHGGAISSTKMNHELLPDIKGTKMIKQKKEIAFAALNLIEDGDTIAIMSGTTTFELIKLLTNKKDLTVILNDIHFAAWLEENTDFTLIILAGMLRNKYHSVYSPVRNELLDLINIDKVFFSCNGFSISKGVTTPYLESALSIRQVLEASCSRCLMSDSSKFDAVTFSKIADLNEITLLITDDCLTDEDRAQLQQYTEVITAPK